MNEKRSLKLSILGRTYSIITDEDECVINSAASLVDSLIHQVMQKGADETKAATLVALQIATSLTKSQNQLASFDSRVEELDSLLKEELS